MKAVADYKITSDSELVGLLKSQGDRLAYTEIYRRYARFLLSFARRKVDDREVAMDIIHDMYAEIWDKRSALDPEQNFERYLFRSVRNRIIDFYKHAKVSERYLEYFRGECERDEDATDHLVRHKDLASVIQKEIDALPEKMRTIFELSRKTNMSRKEISEHLSLTENQVKGKMEGALRILKGRLGRSFYLIFFV